MRDDLPHREPGATLPDGLPAQAALSPGTEEGGPDPGGPGAGRGYSRDAKTMRDVADGLRRWSG
ncbi:hypothetical protein [Nocardia salmonicida]|uniref:hypothetical protein n=1 Tax=Nocardia salmonicida TaxID=53431 RepID=UPI000A3FFDFE|nr:hypothetical protein [Nocardia salmonicida]